MKELFGVVLFSVLVFCFIDRSEGVCNFCAYASLCDRCEGCPCDHDPTCEFCKYCQFCAVASLCDTYCSEGSYLKTITDYLGQSVANLGEFAGLDMSMLNQEKLNSEIDTLLVNPSRYGREVSKAKQKDKAIRYKMRKAVETEMKKVEESKIAETTVDEKKEPAVETPAQTEREEL